jgi:hypothetical protein
MRIVLVAAVALVLAGCGSSGGKAPSASELAPVRTPYSPKVDPADFVRRIDNPLFPLRPGTTFLYRGERGRVRQVDEEVVTHRTKEILGIASTVVLDTVSEHGRPIERTLDFYAQDRDGNVWYLGEDSFELERGRFVRASDSWRSGVDGAKPGIIMPADPQAGDKYRQEYYPQGEALDEAAVLGERGPVTVPYGTFERPLVTSEYSPLEPQTEQKFYAAGVGEVLERVVKGHHEEFRLVAVTH